MTSIRRIELLLFMLALFVISEASESNYYELPSRSKTGDVNSSTHNLRKGSAVLVHNITTNNCTRVQHIEQKVLPWNARRFKRSDDNSRLPENFKVGQAIGGGDCFFDSLAQGLKQLKPGMDFTVKSLREVCKRFAQSQLETDQSWLKEALKNEVEPFTIYVPRIEFTNEDVQKNSESVNVLGLTTPIWGRSEIEGRIICKEYKVKLRVHEKHVVEGKEEWLDQIVNSEGSRSVDRIDYNEENTVHIINMGNGHFEPILDSQEIQNQFRGSDSDEERTKKAELIRKGKFDQFKSLLEADIIDRNNKDNSPLHYVVRREISKRFNEVETHSKQGKEVNDKLKEFVKSFVHSYEKILSEYYERLESQKPKSGKWASFGNEVITEGKSRTKGMETAGVGLNFFQRAITSIGIRYNRKRLKKLLDQLNAFKKDRKKFREELVQSGIEIFQSFESQFVRVTADGSWERAMEKLAHDAVNRIINYSRKSTEKGFSSSLITKGIVFGESKKYKHTSIGVRHNTPGHTLEGKDSKSWNTAKLFNKVGIVTVKRDGTADKYYKKRDGKSDVSKYGYRLLFKWETEDQVALAKKLNVEYEEAKPPREGYKYILKPYDEEKLKNVLLYEINKQDPKIVQELLVEETEQIKQNVEERFNKLEKQIGENTKLLNEVISNIDVVQKQIPVWFDMRESVQLFTGRQTQLEQIATAINQGMIVINGLGGVGKSELAVKYAHSHYSKEDSVIWINAETLDSAKDSFRRLLKELGLKTRDQDGDEKSVGLMAKEVYDFFAGKQGLFIFDNAEEHSIIKEFLPPRTSGYHVLITSQNVQLFNEQEHGKIEKLSLDTLPQDKATEFVKKALNINNALQDKEITELVEALGYLPLALQHAVSYIKESGYVENIGKYEEIYKKSEQEIQSFLNRKGLSSYDKPIFVTFKTTTDKVKKEENGELAEEILNTIAYFAPDNIGKDTFLKLALDRVEESDESIKINRANGMLMRAINLLAKYSAINLREEKISIHRLVQQVIRLELDKQNKAEKEVLEKTLGLLKEYMVNRDSAENYIPHIISVWNYANKYDKLIENFIVNNVGSREAYTTYFHLITGSSSYEVVKNIINKLDELNKLKEVINAKDKERRTPLHNAALSGEEQIVRLLIDKGAKVNAKKKHEWTSLHLAAENGHLGVVNVLLERHANINAKTGYKFTPLHLAAKSNHLKVVQALLKNSKIDINAETKYKFTPLHLAAEKGHSEIVGALLGKDANIDAMDNGYFTPLHLAAKNGHLEVINVLLDKGANIIAKTTKGNTPLHLAAEKGHSEIVRALLGTDAYIDAKDNGDFTPLHLAAQNGHLEVINVLLDKGANINDKTTKGNTPLHLAAEKGHSEIVRALLGKVANIDAKDNGDFTPLHLAVQNGHLEVINVLLDKGANINAKTTRGNTPLHLAAEKGHSEIVRAPFGKIANIDAKDNGDFMPLHLAAQNGHLEVINVLIDKGAKTSKDNTPLHLAARDTAVPGNNEEVIRMILEKMKEKYNKEQQQMYESINAKDVEGFTPLMRTAENGKTNAAKILLDYGADLNAQNNDGETALHFAAKGGYQEFVQLLQNNQADSNIKDNNGETPLDLAQDKLSQEPENNAFREITDFLVSVTVESQQRDEQKPVSLEECLRSTNSERSKREAKINKCELSWEDVDEFNTGKDEKKDFTKIDIDSERFVNYIKDLPEEKRDQLIQLADKVKVTGDSRRLVNKLIGNQNLMSHLNRVGRISGIAMYGMMSKNVLADFLNEDYQGVAINVGFIAGGQGFAKVAETASLKGLNLASEGKLLLGRSLRAASPFLARGTSAFVIYDLVNQVKAIKNGTKEALVGVVGDSIYLGVDAAEIGIEIAEAFEILEGVSSVTGPIGAAVGAVIFFGTDIYMAVKRVDKINEIIELTGKERFIEGLRAFIGMQPEEQIQDLMQEKQISNQLVKHGLEYLKHHSDIQSYVFPTGRSVVDSCRKVPYKTSQCNSGGLGGRCLKTHTVTRYAEECTTKFEVDLDNTALLDRKRTDIKWSRAKPDDPTGGQLFCLPRGNHERVPSYGSYLCENAIGITDLSAKTGNHTLINLGEGTDLAKGFTDSPNIFVVNNGSKRYFGGNKDDIFILHGNPITGHFYGEGGINTLDLTSFAPNEGSIDIKLHIGQVEDYYQQNFFRMSGINKFLGRKDKADQVFITCDSDTNDIKFVDGQSGSERFVDHIVVHDKDCAYEMQVVVRPNTVIYNRALKGIFYYIVPYALGSAKVDFIYAAEALSLNNTFTFEYELDQIKNVDVRNINVLNKTSHVIKFNFSPMSENEFNITISGASNPSYRLGNDTEIKVGNSGNLYVLQNTNKSVDEVMRDYSVIAKRLNKMSFFIHSLLSNETVAIGSGNYEVIHNNPLHKSHLVGNGGENVYVIHSESKRFEIPLPEVVIYNTVVESSVDTIDLRNIIQQARDEFSNEGSFKLQIFKSVNDLLLKGRIENPIGDSSMNKLKKGDYFTIILKDGVNWYNNTHVVTGNVPKIISRDNNEWSLKPQPLIFDKDKEIIVVTSEDIEENTELITPRRAGNYKFVRDHGSDLIITNAFNTQEDLCTIVLSRFYETPKMKTLSIKFADRDVVLKDKQKEISTARDIDVVKTEHKKQVYNDVFNPESNQRHTHRHEQSKQEFL